MGKKINASDIKNDTVMMITIKKLRNCIEAFSLTCSLIRIASGIKTEEEKPDVRELINKKVPKL
jgi:hypothetical protein